MRTAAALDLRGVGKSYGFLEKKRALQGVSLQIARGECFGLAGANGAGKTTLIRIMLGLIEPDEGEARLLGERPDDPEVRRRLGFVPEAGILPESASPRSLVRRWARLRGLPLETAIPQGLELLEKLGMAELLDRATGKLSKGERQRTLLALAMLGSPELLVLDEPTDGLDPLGRARMREVIRAQCDAGTTVFLNSHLLAETERICTRVGILHKGQLVRVERLARDRSAGSGVAKSAISLSPDKKVIVAHENLEQLNAEIDRLRGEGQLLIEVRRVTADLESSLAEVVAAPEDALEPAIDPAPREPLPALEPLADSRWRPQRALVATFRVAREIAADLSSRRIGWFALGAASIAAVLFFVGVRSDVASGAAAAAHQFGANGMTDPAQVGAFISATIAKVFFWLALVGGTLLSAVFIPSLLDPRRTVLLYSLPITRSDYALGIWIATCALALLSCCFFFALGFAGMRWLEIQAPVALLLAPLLWIIAFSAILALQMLATLPVRNALFSGAAGIALLFGTAILAGHFGPQSGHPSHQLWGILYALLPRSTELMEEAGKLAGGTRINALAILPTLGLLAAYLLFLRALALRSER